MATKRAKNQDQDQAATMVAEPEAMPAAVEVNEQLQLMAGHIGQLDRAEADALAVACERRALALVPGFDPPADLADEVAAFNRLVAEHESRWKSWRRDRSEMPLQDLAGRQLMARAQHLQADRVDLYRERLQLVRSRVPLLLRLTEAAAEQLKAAEDELEAVKASQRKKLDDDGIALDAEPAYGINPTVAEHQLMRKVCGSKPVIAAQSRKVNIGGRWSEMKRLRSAARRDAEAVAAALAKAISDLMK